MTDDDKTTDEGSDEQGGQQTTNGDEYRYDKLSWPEINEAVEDEKMIVVPVGATEDHGHHLPVDVDRVIAEEICDRTVRDRDDTLLFPTIDHGYLPHHMDFPGGITIGWETFIKYMIDVCVSISHHGFDKILLVNGHGSNHHLLEQVTRQVILQHPDTHCAMLSWWELEEVREAARELRDAGPHGTSHGGEMETSIYMHLYPENVDNDAAPRDLEYPESKHFNAYDLAGERDPEWSTSVTMMEWWSTLSETGTRGDASVATPEKGKQFLDAAVEGMHSVLDEFKEYPHRQRTDHHARETGPRDYDPFRPK